MVVSKKEMKIIETYNRYLLEEFGIDVKKMLKDKEETSKKIEKMQKDIEKLSVDNELLMKHLKTSEDKSYNKNEAIKELRKEITGVKEDEEIKL